MTRRKALKQAAKSPDEILSKEEGRVLDHNAPSKVDFKIELNFRSKPERVSTDDLRREHEEWKRKMIAEGKLSPKRLPKK